MEGTFTNVLSRNNNKLLPMALHYPSPHCVLMVVLISAADLLGDKLLVFKQLSDYHSQTTKETANLNPLLSTRLTYYDRASHKNVKSLFSYKQRYETIYFP